MALLANCYHSETFGSNQKNSWISDLHNDDECSHLDGNLVNDIKPEQRKNNITCSDEGVCNDKTRILSIPCASICLSDKAKGGDTGPFEASIAAQPTHDPKPSENKPQDVRPKIFTRPQSKTLKSKMKVSNRRKKNKSRSRTNLDAKWKPVDRFQLGFYVVSSLYEPDLSFESREICDNSYAIDDVSECRFSSTEDDAVFFLSLGIDVSYSGPYHDDDILDWDSLSFKNDIPAVKSQKVPVLQKSSKLSENNNSQSKTSRLKEAAPTSCCRAIVHPSHFLNSIDILGLGNISKHVLYKLFELESSSTANVRIRSDRDRRVQKAHRSIKTKHCLSVKNNDAGKLLYMHHRLYKKLEPSLGFSSYDGRTRLTKTPKGYDRVKDVLVRPVSSSRSRDPRAPPAQNLKYALDNSSAPRDIDNQLSAFLISLQHREMTPEDYDMLLRLDDGVKSKTVSTSVLKKLKTEVVPTTGLEAMCAVCMEPYTAGQERKFLPCGHDYHSGCIDTWLNNSSMNCPLDGLPVDGS